MKREASAQWNGTLLKGNGTLSGPSGVLKDVPYSFKARFEEGITGTNPEELIAAAHAGCFSMALAHSLDGEGYKPESISTKATLQFERGEDGFSITGIHLQTTVKVPDIDRSTFDRIANGAKEGCPVSKALSPPITLDAKLEG